MDEEINFALLSRFYIICFYKDENPSEMTKALKRDLTDSITKEKSPLELELLTLKKLVPLKFNEYDSLGYFEIRVKKLELDDMNKLKPNEQTSALYQLSKAIERISKEKNMEKRYEFFLDAHNPPYIVNITVESSKRIKS
ncbi:MAG: hypothetical protein ACFFCQ_02660 [Promethearchaeota archaeon]